MSGTETRPRRESIAARPKPVARGPGFAPAGFFVLRTPLLPFDELLAWSEGLAAPQALAEAPADPADARDPAAARLDRALEDDRKILRARLQALAARPEVREALLVASPPLDESIPVWLASPDSERGVKVERTVVRYLARMAGRPTPFGLFAGCSFGRVAAEESGAGFSPRVGNVLLRPVLRSHEIPFLGASGAPRDRHIPITDLHVSVAGERVVLRSHRLGREVIPRLTSAHAYNLRSLGVYHFLCALQTQDVASLGWRWGALEAAAFLPRVVIGKVVLPRARWRLGETQLRQLGDSAALHRRVHALRAALGLPRHVALADGDNLLPIDLDNALNVDVFAQ